MIDLKCITYYENSNQINLSKCFKNRRLRQVRIPLLAVLSDIINLSIKC